MCMEAPHREAAKTYLLALIAGVDPDPQKIMEQATCFTCISPEKQKAMQNYLLCQILNV